MADKIESTTETDTKVNSSKVLSQKNSKDNSNLFFLLGEFLVFVLTILTSFGVYKYEPSNNFLYLTITVFWLTVSLYLYYSYHNNKLKKSYDNQDKDKYSSIKQTIYDIDRSILKYNLVGVIALIITISAMVILGIYVFTQFGTTIDQIKTVELVNINGTKTIVPIPPSTMTLAIVLYILRTSLVGTLIITFLIHSFKFTNASFDQATRFNKRKHATLFLLEVVTDFNGLTTDNIEKIMTAFKEWNVTVESAYTDIDFNSKMAIKTLDKLDKTEENNNNLITALINKLK